MLVAVRKPVAIHQQPRMSFPTVLVVVRNDELRRDLVDDLSHDRSLVLEADNEGGAIVHVMSHSRPIHVVLVEMNLQDLGKH